MTHVDGIRNVGRHNKWPALAIDIVVLIGGKGSYDETLYFPLVNLCRKHGLVSGGSWLKFADFPHIQIADSELA